ncbi:hypothetical protein PVAND_005608 [Polypedilum vanderplanki]|uniref:LITAF domain-containing protein n=1 Tax=Polypedilum vanderplanki TaxID=319348 RepID=A0A9J6C146_POLVA|nr:hypothetical protein PVAND_005608 [Polypedilum vanderplanki]
MSGEPTAPPLTPQNMGFIVQQQPHFPIPPPPYPTNFTNDPSSNSLPYPGSNSLPYPQSNSLPYPPSDALPYPSSNSLPYPSFNPQSTDVQTTQPTANTTNTIIVQPPQLGSDPVVCYCPNCNENVTTKVDYKAGTQTHLSAALLCALNDDCCCALLPYCCNCTKDAHHYCPKCNHYFGKSQPFG